MSTTTDSRKAAEERVRALIAVLHSAPAHPECDRLIEECESLARAIDAFHMEGIRFRMFTVDRTLARGTLPLPPDAARLFSEVRELLEAAGFHTRSHQAPGS